MSPSLMKFPLTQNTESSPKIPMKMSPKDTNKSAMYTYPQPALEKHKYSLYSQTTESSGRPQPKEMHKKALPTHADHQKPQDLGAPVTKATSTSKRTIFPLFSKTTRTQHIGPVSAEQAAADKIADCHLRGGGGDSLLSRNSTGTNTSTQAVSGGGTVSSRTSVQYKPFHIWNARPDVLAIPKNDEDREHGMWCKLKKKAKAKFGIKQQAMTTPFSTHNHKHKFRQGHCKRCGLAELEHNSGTPLTSGAFCVQRCCASGEETSTYLDGNRVSEAPPQLSPIRITRDDDLSLASTRFTNETSTAFDATSPSVVDTDATSISFISDDLEVGGSPLPRSAGSNDLSAYYARSGTALSAISEAPTDDVSSVEEFDVSDRYAFEETTLVNETPSATTVRRRKAVYNLQDIADGQRSLDASPVSPSSALRANAVYIAHDPLVPTSGDIYPTPLTSAMKGRVWGQQLSEPEQTLPSQNASPPKPAHSQDAAYDLGSTLQQKIDHTILTDVIHASSYGNIPCQDALLSVYSNCTHRPRIYTMALRRLLRKGYLILELFCLADARLISWEIANTIRSQLFPSRVDNGNETYEDAHSHFKLVSYIQHSVSTGALPKMCANQVLVLLLAAAANDPNSEESAAEKAVFADRELFGLERFITVDGSGSIDRQVHVATYDRFFAPGRMAWDTLDPNPQMTPSKRELRKKASMHIRKDSYSPERETREIQLEESSPSHSANVRSGLSRPVDDSMENAEVGKYGGADQLAQVRPNGERLSANASDRVNALWKRHARAVNKARV